MLHGNPKAIEELLSILGEETKDDESGRLATAMRQGGLVKFETAFRALEELKRGIEERQG